MRGQVQEVERFSLRASPVYIRTYAIHLESTYLQLSDPPVAHDGDDGGDEGDRKEPNQGEDDTQGAGASQTDNGGGFYGRMSRRGGGSGRVGQELAILEEALVLADLLPSLVDLAKRISWSTSTRSSDRQLVVVLTLNISLTLKSSSMPLPSLLLTRTSNSSSFASRFLLRPKLSSLPWGPSHTVLKCRILLKKIYYSVFLRC